VSSEPRFSGLSRHRVPDRRGGPERELSPESVSGRRVRRLVRADAVGEDQWPYRRERDQSRMEGHDREE
jgi:hypothetical protein